MSGGYDVDHEVVLVQWYAAKVGTKQDDGTYKCTFGDLFYDEEAEQIFESLVGSLKAARRQGVLNFPGQLLLMPVHKDVELHLLKPLPEGTPKPAPPKAVSDNRY
eukprot:CAMPEP_0174251806 /NCGR_PEP_ID=MMETSP0439-20130205/1514_1 /TAXON_ID=0 /ORGANISM="Stereomyxa ramosa, Strain Chinc5" /LENGTH=104 /DNA_ID=CAMNT_0015332221 /DNA_START=16 /DNA_END=330 /DNA_ORIENTATION=-